MEHNPYKILGVFQSASKAEITKAVAIAMKRKQYPVDVIAKAQKSLMKAEERIIADYLLPILPTIKRFKTTDLSALLEPEPTLSFLSEFDGLEEAIIKANQEQLKEREPLPISLSELLTEGITAAKEGHYPKAVKYLEDYCQTCNQRNSKDYIQAQIWLIQVYQVMGQLQRAIALCKILSQHPHPQVHTWANKTLISLSKSQEISHV
ncbi:MAG: molecular chaperone DnaJ [Calothrix sp. MO_167.B42]|nr:molecular chaperone DnaJ [Calothrix sp. MO_167.B42]